MFLWTQHNMKSVINSRWWNFHGFRYWGVDFGTKRNQFVIWWIVVFLVEYFELHLIFLGSIDGAKFHDNDGLTMGFVYIESMQSDSFGLRVILRVCIVYFAFCLPKLVSANCELQLPTFPMLVSSNNTDSIFSWVSANGLNSVQKSFPISIAH